jgi:hypothetical protein
MKIHEFLKDRPDRWTQNGVAKNSKGRLVNLDSKNAVCWCLMGLCGKIKNTNHFMDTEEYQKIRSELDDSVGLWNDDPKRTFEDVYNLTKKLDV